LAVLTFWGLIRYFGVLGFTKVKLSVSVLLLCVYAILLGKAIPEMTYTVSSRTLNHTHSLTIHTN